MSRVITLAGREYEKNPHTGVWWCKVGKQWLYPVDNYKPPMSTVLTDALEQLSGAKPALTPDYYWLDGREHETGTDDLYQLADDMEWYDYGPIAEVYGMAEVYRGFLALVPDGRGEVHPVIFDTREEAEAALNPGGAC